MDVYPSVYGLIKLCLLFSDKKPSWRTTLLVKEIIFSVMLKSLFTSLTWRVESWRKTITTISHVWKQFCKTPPRPKSSASSTRWISCRRTKGIWWVEKILSSNLISLNSKLFMGNIEISVFEIAWWTGARDQQKQRRSSKTPVYAGPKEQQLVLFFF